MWENKGVSFSVKLSSLRALKQECKGKYVLFVSRTDEQSKCKDMLYFYILLCFFKGPKHMEIHCIPKLLLQTLFQRLYCRLQQDITGSGEDHHVINLCEFGSGKRSIKLLQEHRARIYLTEQPFAIYAVSL